MLAGLTCIWLDPEAETTPEDLCICIGEGKFSDNSLRSPKQQIRRSTRRRIVQDPLLVPRTSKRLTFRLLFQGSMSFESLNISASLEEVPKKRTSYFKKKGTHSLKNIFDFTTICIMWHNYLFRLFNK